MQWISLKEQTPGIEKTCFLLDEAYKFHIGDIDPLLQVFYLDKGDTIEYSKIIYWCYAPEMPKEKDKTTRERLEEALKTFPPPLLYSPAEALFELRNIIKLHMAYIQETIGK